MSSAANVASCFLTVESSQKASSSEIPKLSEDLKNKERELDDFENGDRGLNKLWSNLTEINRKVSRVNPQKPGLDSKQGLKVNRKSLTRQQYYILQHCAGQYKNLKWTFTRYESSSFLVDSLKSSLNGR